MQRSKDDCAWGASVKTARIARAKPLKQCKAAKTKRLNTENTVVAEDAEKRDGASGTRAGVCRTGVQVVRKFGQQGRKYFSLECIFFLHAVIIHGAGYGHGIFILLFLPVLWCLPTAFMIGELSSVLPQEGGYYA